MQSGNSCSHKKFPSKSCPLRYGASKIQEDAFNLFQAALREYMCSYGINNQVNNNNAWRITSLSVSASKIFAVPAVSSKSNLFLKFNGSDAFCLLCTNNLTYSLCAAVHCSLSILLLVCSMNLISYVVFG